MKAWLKGGLIGAGIVFLYLFVYFLIYLYSLMTATSVEEFAGPGFIFIYAILTIPGFLIGALIGLIFGKIKIKAWLKGGLIFLGLNILLAILSRIMLKDFWGIGVLVISYPLVMIFRLLNFTPENQFIIFVLLGALMWFFVGAFIGFVVGKIKEREQVRQEVAAK